MWFTLSGVDRVGRVTMAGEVTEYPAPGALPVGRHGRPGRGPVVHPQPAERRRTADHRRPLAPPVPCRPGAPRRWASPAGPDGALWFTEIGAGRIGRITVDGEITEYPLPDPLARPHAVTAGPDGALWFTEWGEWPGRPDHRRRPRHLGTRCPAPTANRTASPGTTAPCGAPWKPAPWPESRSPHDRPRDRSRPRRPAPARAAPPGRPPPSRSSPTNASRSATSPTTTIPTTPPPSRRATCSTPTGRRS